LILISKFDDEIESDSLISKYPGTKKDYQDLFELHSRNINADKYLPRTTWIEAICYYNRLSIDSSFPLVDVSQYEYG
jgi:hypothetical protein